MAEGIPMAAFTHLTRVILNFRKIKMAKAAGNPLPEPMRHL